MIFFIVAAYIVGAMSLVLVLNLRREHVDRYESLWIRVATLEQELQAAKGRERFETERLNKVKKETYDLNVRCDAFQKRMDEMEDLIQSVKEK